MKEYPNLNVLDFQMQEFMEALKKEGMEDVKGELHVFYNEHYHPFFEAIRVNITCDPPQYNDNNNNEEEDVPF